MMLRSVWSGGQTGVDRAALDAAREAGLDMDGFCPKGRLAEDGVIPPEYPLTEAESPYYPVRTQMNVSLADATLILTLGPMGPGTLLTVRTCDKLHKPVVCIALEDAGGHGREEAVAGWIRAHGFETLNVAGPRESSRPGAYAKAKAFLARVFDLLQGGEGDGVR